MAPQAGKTVRVRLLADLDRKLKTTTFARNSGPKAANVAVAKSTSAKNSDREVDMLKQHRDRRTERRRL